MRVTRLKVLLALVLFSLPAFGQVNTGELRLKVSGATGAGLQSSVELISNGSRYKNVANTEDNGTLDFKSLPFGIYVVKVEKPGFLTISKSIDVRTALPIELLIHLELAPIQTSVTVSDEDTLIDPFRPNSMMQIDSGQIEDSATSLPGRTVQDQVNSQPGWLYEGNAVLHPRGSEYQVQFVVDGLAFTDNRSPSFGPEIESENVDTMRIYTAGIPAEYGRKMGGVVELATHRSTSAGLHGDVDLTGGSYTTGVAFGQAQYVWGKNALGASADGGTTEHFLNPVVPENYTNTATTGDFSANFERDFTPSDRLMAAWRHEFSRYLVPNELPQQAAGQRQNGDNFETLGTAGYQHVFSQNALMNVDGMFRDNSNNFYSNAASTPIIVFQHNSFQEAYVKVTGSVHKKNQEWKAGVETDNIFLNENYSDLITDPSQFDPGAPLTFHFTGDSPDLEQSAFVEDLIRLGNWTISAGLRWDHYQLLVNQNALSPRVAVGRYFQSQNMVVHAAYDRVFQTPSFENILISSSPQTRTLDPEVLHLPVRPSTGNYYEVGLSKGFADALRMDVNVYRRDLRNFADDDQLLSTGVSFPIAFYKGVIYGSEGKLDLVHWRKLSGFVSYSYMVGNASYPVTGGLFLGSDVDNAQPQLVGHFPISQDQRNSVRTRFQYQIIPKLWAAAGLEYGSGLPFEYDGTEEDAIAQYGVAVADRVNFDRGRVDPNLSVNASLGADVYSSDRVKFTLKADVENLNNRLNVIDFAGLYSGNAIAPARSWFLRLAATF